MAADNGVREPVDRTTKRRPFSSWVKRIAHFKGGDQHRNSSRKHDAAAVAAKQKKSNGLHSKKDHHTQSSRQRHEPSSSSHNGTNGHAMIASPSTHPPENARCSYESLEGSSNGNDLDGQNRSNRSGAPTLATNADTINSDTAQSRAPTTTTGARALSSIGGNSTFSSPNQSVQSLTTTLTTIQSHSPGNAIQRSSNPVLHGTQYDTTISAIPRYMNDAIPSTYASATANNLLSDNASLLTLASSSKRRRRSLESQTDASVRAIWSGSRESLPLSVLSGTVEPSTGPYTHTASRPSLTGLPSAERTSLYSSQGISAPALASERNSYYAASLRNIGDAKSLRSITNIDTRSQYDTKSINDTKSMDLASLRNYEGSIRSAHVSHARNDSIPGSIGGALPTTPGPRQSNLSGAARRSGDWQDVDERGD